MSEELQHQLCRLSESTQLYSDICHIIDDTRNRVAVYVNAEVSRTYWYIGKRIKEDVLFNRRGEYGKQVVRNLSIRLTERYGKGWSYSTLQHCVRAAYTFTEDEIAYAVRTQFSWTTLRSLMSVSYPLARKFYMQMCYYEHWDTRTLDQKIDTQSAPPSVVARKMSFVKHLTIMRISLC